MQKQRLPNQLKLFPLFIGLVVWTASVQSYPFFWDSVQLASKHAHHFFENGLRWTPLPTEIDSGHPPVFGYYVALVWSVAGKTLPAGHWAMLPFLCGLVWLLYRLGRRVAGEKWAIWLIPMVLFDPVMAGQSAMVSPDIVLAFCFLLAVEGVLSRKQIWVAIGTLGLCAISTRGMMTAAALMFWQISVFWRADSKTKPQRWFVLAFLPGFAFAAWFLWWHHQATGWTGYHAASPWSPAFETAKGVQLIRNLLVVGWRWTDFGRIFEWAALAFLLFRAGRGDGRQSDGAPSGGSAVPAGVIPGLLVMLVLFLTPTAIIYKTLSAHRYFLPLFMVFHLYLFRKMINSNLKSSVKKGLLALVLAGLLSGNCWIYPRGISMDWDATLAHLPYHHLRAQMIAIIDAEKISFESVGTAFPNINTGENLLLNGDQRIFAEKDFSRNKYVLASNIFNDFSEEEFNLLERHWQLLQHLERRGVWIKLYQRPE